MMKLTNDWHIYLEETMNKPYYKELIAYVEEEYKTKEVYPPKDKVFHALNTTSYEATQVVILGQDPYHGPGQAHGMAFSVQPHVAIPPSLKNIYKELHESLGCTPPNHGFLEHWAKQGVLLLNTVLTVRKKEPGAHQNKGWETFTDTIIQCLNAKETPVIFLLWGGPAQKKQKLITSSKHIVLTSSHPSPLAAYRGFLGCNHFKQVNAYLQAQGKPIIDWEIPPLKKE